VDKEMMVSSINNFRKRQVNLMFMFLLMMGMKEAAKATMK